LPLPGKDVLVGIGDDVAVLRATSGRVWLATCDVQVEGFHFLRNSISPRDLGHKALAINLSDIASTGGAPRFALVSLGLPKDLPVDYVDELYEGMRAEAEQFGVDIVGGNISSSDPGVFVDIFLLGEAFEQDVLLRSGARVGDKILVTGTLGDAAAGVALLLDTELSTEEPYLALARARRDNPSPRVREGKIIGKAHLATAMIDISDGLAGDLGHLCERSSVGARINAQHLPVANPNRALALASHNDEWYFALHGGEDYELLFTSPPEQAERLAASIEQETGTKVSIIGDILKAEEGQKLVLPGGKIVSLQPFGWDHFKKGRISN
jgi:thiamine-monophosphate kinase